MMWALLLSYYVSWNLVTFVVYGVDKLAAHRRGSRVSEQTLHFLVLLGGGVGALFGQKVFNHKTKKRQFRLVFWLTFVVNTVLVLLVLYRWFFLFK